MSLASWKREFYRTPAKKCSKRYALRHSLKKWTGLLRRNLRKHSIKLYGGYFLEDKDYNEFYINADTCALCVHYHDDCDKCPLGKYSGSCDTIESPYNKFNKHNKVLPMINAIKATIKQNHKQ